MQHAWQQGHRVIAATPVLVPGRWGLRRGRQHSLLRGSETEKVVVSFASAASLLHSSVHTKLRSTGLNLLEMCAMVAACRCEGGGRRCLSAALPPRHDSRPCNPPPRTPATPRPSGRIAASRCRQASRALLSGLAFEPWEHTGAPAGAGARQCKAGFRCCQTLPVLVNNMIIGMIEECEPARWIDVGARAEMPVGDADVGRTSYVVSSQSAVEHVQHQSVHLPPAWVPVCRGPHPHPCCASCALIALQTRRITPPPIRFHLLLAPPQLLLPLVLPAALQGLP